MAEPQPLDERLAILLREAPDSDPLVQRVTIALHRASRALSRTYRQALAETGISYPDYQVLRALALTGTPYTLNPSQIALECGQTQSTMTARLESLEDRGLVRREPDPRNRVRVNVVLTQRGHDTWQRAYASAAEAERSVLAVLDDVELRTLDTLLSRLEGAS
jgi:DNA-binding MarR family transcriptional regulator